MGMLHELCPAPPVRVFFILMLGFFCVDGIAGSSEVYELDLFMSTAALSWGNIPWTDWRLVSFPYSQTVPLVLK